MGKVIPFRKPALAERARQKTLCRSKFHKWKIDKAKRFDVKSGRLVSVWRCERCGKTKTELT